MRFGSICESCLIKAMFRSSASNSRWDSVRFVVTVKCFYWNSATKIMRGRNTMPKSPTGKSKVKETGGGVNFKIKDQDLFS